ncbi:DUF2235 domain-containing protein [Acidovorax sp.]|uniref:T6SS phospholipase effector Tle1-like catalytic domain-containing protein n=1 Tax=Acidovorax sp. TaxID=1872122 RepID=UPI002ACE36DE|nr:DUF2235 domain-containing protein [Acidovorax sp.]MDZ7864356.1 DUF2235 domain-containing protein [Acidovorax sp.]
MLAKQFWRLLLASVAVLGLLGCSSGIYHQQQLIQFGADPVPGKKGAQLAASLGPRTHAIFFDGTANDAESSTNVKRLHSMVSLQDKPHLSTLYVEGVGVGNDAFGAGLGLGAQSRVVLAYNFLLNNYRAGDKVYIFGFSRGAYQARVLASMMQYVGLPDAPPQLTLAADLTPRTFSEQVQYASAMYDEMREAFLHRRYPCTIARVRGGPNSDGTTAYKSRPVAVLGLWDTVGALGGGVSGWPARLLHKGDIRALHVDIDEPNQRYGDQLHNVENVLHAVSLDDNREWIFTPLLVTRQHLVGNKRLPERTDPLAKIYDNCASGTPATVTHSELQGEPKRIEEVWFPGAHSDVGGGYVGSDLSGLSLNWMITMLEQVETGIEARFRLLPAGTKVREDVYGSSHDPEASMSAMYHRINRNLAAYALGQAKACSLAGDPAACGDAGVHEPMAQFAGQLCMHPSVAKRRVAMPPRANENRYLDLRHTGSFCVAPDTELANPPVLRQVFVPPGALCPVGAAQVKVRQWSPTSKTCEDMPQGPAQ